MKELDENEIAKIILNTAFRIHKELGPGLFESVYEGILSYELSEYGLYVQKQVPIPIIWRDIQFEQGFRADLIIDNKVLIEVKSVENLGSVHPKQVLTYLKLTKLKLGLLINFNESLLKNGIKRIVNNL